MSTGSVTNATLYYVHDPMCSWCWGFKASFELLESGLAADIKIERILGGLAPDSDEPMPKSTQEMVRHNWERIQTVIPGTEFNYDFWTKNTPQRSTWPSCRAVIAARRQQPEFERPMIKAIQEAYYLNARNPSDHNVLTEIAGQVGCDTAQFSQDLNSDSVKQELMKDFTLSQSMGIQGFPSLVLKSASGQLRGIRVDYNNPAAMLAHIKEANVA